MVLSFEIWIGVGPVAKCSCDRDGNWNQHCVLFISIVHYPLVHFVVHIYILLFARV